MTKDAIIVLLSFILILLLTREILSWFLKTDEIISLLEKIYNKLCE